MTTRTLAQHEVRIPAQTAPGIAVPDRVCDRESPHLAHFWTLELSDFAPMPMRVYCNGVEP